MNYWLDLFTGTTWKEFRDAGAGVSGFSTKRRSVAQRVVLSHRKGLSLIHI